MNFKQKVVWLTGASSGIGKGLALELSKAGALLVLSSRNETALREVRSRCISPENVKILVMDMADHSQMTLRVAEACTLFGRIDVLINNAGISQRSFARDTALEVDKRLMDVNYFGTVALSKALLPVFMDQGRGHYLVVTSVVGKMGTPLRSGYAASKHALHGFFNSFRAELPESIKVCIVCPGYVRTSVSVNALTGDGSAQKKMDRATENGLSPAAFSRKLIRAMAGDPHELFIGGYRERAALFLQRFFPKLNAKILRKVRVT